MNTPASILEKIRSLLRLAKSDNAHEAKLAMEKAVEIAAKHQLDLGNISPEDDLHKILGERLPCPARLAREYVGAYNIAHGFFNVNITVIQGASQVLFVGTKLDIEIADYVCTYLVRACRQALAKWKAGEKAARRKTTGSKVANFIDGFFYAIWLNLRHQRASQITEHAGLALVIKSGHEARDAATQGILKGKITELALAPARRDRHALGSGFVSGKDTQINPGLRGNQSVLALK